MGTRMKFIGLVAVLVALAVLLLSVPAMAYDGGSSTALKLIKGNDGWYVAGIGDKLIKLELVSQEQKTTVNGVTRTTYYKTTYSYKYPYPIKYIPMPYTPKPGTPSSPPAGSSDPQPAPAQPADPNAGQLTADEKAMLNLLNQERVKMGLKPLEIDMRLVDLARKKSKDMIDNNYFSHTSPTYGSPFDMMKAAGVTYTYAGENLAGAPTVSRAHTALMNSPGHRANILNKNFTHVGIGVVDGGPYGKMFTQMFIGK